MWFASCNPYSKCIKDCHYPQSIVKKTKEISDLPNLELVLVTGKLVYKPKEPNSSICALNNSTSCLSSPRYLRIIIREHLESLKLWLVYLSTNFPKPMHGRHTYTYTHTYTHTYNTYA